MEPILNGLILDKKHVHVIIKSHEITESEIVTEKLRNEAHSSSVLAAGKVHTFQAFFLRNPRPNSTVLLLLTVEDSSMLLLMLRENVGDGRTNYTLRI